jgi:hypothetical protein
MQSEELMQQTILAASKTRRLSNGDAKCRFQDHWTSESCN